MSHEISTHKQLSIAQRHVTTVSASFHGSSTTIQQQWVTTTTTMMAQMMQMHRLGL